MKATDGRIGVPGVLGHSRICLAATPGVSDGAP